MSMWAGRDLSENLFIVSEKRLTISTAPSSLNVFFNINTNFEVNLRVETLNPFRDVARGT